MSTNQTILLGALLIAASVFVAKDGPPSARAAGNGPYALMQHSNTSANAGVFRIDTATGDVSYCFVSQTNQLVCSQSVR